MSVLDSLTTATPVKLAAEPLAPKASKREYARNTERKHRKAKTKERNYIERKKGALLCRTAASKSRFCAASQIGAHRPHGRTDIANNSAFTRSPHKHLLQFAQKLSTDQLALARQFFESGDGALFVSPHQAKVGTALTKVVTETYRWHRPFNLINLDADFGLHVMADRVGRGGSCTRFRFEVVRTEPPSLLITVVHCTIDTATFEARIASNSRTVLHNTDNVVVKEAEEDLYVLCAGHNDQLELYQIRGDSAQSVREQVSLAEQKRKPVALSAADATKLGPIEIEDVK